MKKHLIVLGAAFAAACTSGPPTGADRVAMADPGARIGSRLQVPGATCATSSPTFAFAAIADASHASCWQYDLGYKGLDRWYLQVVKSLHVPCKAGVTDAVCLAPYNDASFVRMCVARWHPAREANGTKVLPGYAPEAGVEAPCAGAKPGQANLTGPNGCAVCAEQKVPHPKQP